MNKIPIINGPWCSWRYFLYVECHYEGQRESLCSLCSISLHGRYSNNMAANKLLKSSWRFFWHPSKWCCLMLDWSYEDDMSLILLQISLFFSKSLEQSFRTDREPEGALIRRHVPGAIKITTSAVDVTNSSYEAAKKNQKTRATAARNTI